MENANVNEVPRTITALAEGSHRNREGALCLLEAVAYVAGEPHSDHPQCVDPVLGAYGRALNDAMNDEERLMLVPLIPKLIGTVGDQALALRRAMLLCDASVRQIVPLCFDACGLGEHAEKLRALKPITSDSAADSAASAAYSAASAARSAASAAYSAASAARSAADSAAYSAADSAAYSAADSAASAASAAYSAASAAYSAASAAYNAARSAAYSAADSAASAARSAASAARSSVFEAAVKAFEAAIEITAEVK